MNTKPHTLPARLKAWTMVAARATANPEPHTPTPNPSRKPTQAAQGGRGVAGQEPATCEEPARRLVVSTN